MTSIEKYIPVDEIKYTLSNQKNLKDKNYYSPFKNSEKEDGNCKSFSKLQEYFGH